MGDNLSNPVSDDAFWEWLKSRVTPRQLSEMYRYAYLLKDYYVPKYHFSSILEEMARTSSDAVRKIITQDKHYQNKYGGYDRQFIFSLLDYMDFYIKENKLRITADPVSHDTETKVANNEDLNIMRTSDQQETFSSIKVDCATDTTGSVLGKTEQDILSSKKSESDVGHLQPESTPKDDYASETSNEIIDFTNIGDISFCRPVSIQYYGKKNSVDSWRALYGLICQFLRFEHPAAFERMREEFFQGIGSIRLVDAANKNKLTVAHSIGDGYFIEVNRSAGDLIRSLKYILDRCGVDYHNVIIEYSRQKTKEEEKNNDQNEDVRLALKKLSNETEEGVSAGMVSKQINGRLIPFQVMQILDKADWSEKIGHNSYRYLQQETTDRLEQEKTDSIPHVSSDASPLPETNSITTKAQSGNGPMPSAGESANTDFGQLTGIEETTLAQKEPDKNPETPKNNEEPSEFIQQTSDFVLVESVRTTLEEISKKKLYGVSAVFIANKINADKQKVLEVLREAEWAKETYDNQFIYLPKKSTSSENQQNSNFYYDLFVSYVEKEAVDKNLISDICESIIDFGKYHNFSKNELFSQNLDQCGQIEGEMWKSLPEVPRRDWLRFRRAVEYYGDFLGYMKEQEKIPTSSESVSDNNSQYSTNDTELIKKNEKNQEINNDKTEKHSDDDFWKWLDARVTPTYITELYSISNELNSVLASIYHYKASVFDEMLISSYETISKDIFSAPNFKQFFDDYQRKRISEYLTFIRDYISSSKKDDSNVVNNDEGADPDQTVGTTVEIDTSPHGEESVRDEAKFTDNQTMPSADETDTQPHSGDSVRVLDLTNLGDLSDTIPVSIQFYKDKITSVKTWEDVYVQFLSLLNSIKRSALFSGMKLSKNSKNIDIGSKIHLRSFKKYRRIPGTSLYVRTEGSANDYLARIKFMLDKNKIPYEKLIITYQEKTSIPSDKQTEPEVTIEPTHTAIIVSEELIIINKESFRKYLDAKSISTYNQVYYCVCLENMAGDFNETLFGKDIEHCLSVVRKIKERIATYGTIASKKDALSYFEQFLSEIQSVSSSNNDDNDLVPMPSESTILIDDTEEWIIAQLKANNIRYQDNRDKNGCLWIVGGHELDFFVQECKRHGYTFIFKADGCRAYPTRNVWWTKNILKKESFDETEKEFPSITNDESEIDVFLEGDEFTDLRNALALQHITTVKELKELQLWSFMNRHNLYSIAKRQSIFSKVNAMLNPVVDLDPSHSYILFVGDKNYKGSSPSDAFYQFCEDMIACYPLQFRLLVGVRLPDGLIPVRKNIHGTNFIKLTNLSAYISTAMSVDEVVSSTEWVRKRCGESFTEITMTEPQSTKVIEEPDSMDTVYSENIPTGINEPEEDYQPEPIDRKTDTFVMRLEQLVLTADIQGLSYNELKNAMSETMVAIKQGVERSVHIVDVKGRLIHKDAFIDWEEGADKLESIMEKLMKRNGGYISADQLYEYAKAEMNLFLTDNNLNDERSVYDIASHLFGKIGYHSKQFFFYGKMHISRKDHPITSNFDIFRTYAADHGGVFSIDGLVDYLNRIGVSSINLRGQMKIPDEPVFFYYDTGILMCADDMHINEEWKASVKKELAVLFNDVGSYIVLRKIPDIWFDRLPFLPSRKLWTPLLLQSILRCYSKELGARTIQALYGQSLDTLHAMLVTNDSPIQNFGDVVISCLIDNGVAQRSFSAEELRHLLVDAGMIQGNELWTNMPKALKNDGRFAWNAAGDQVTVKV